MLTFESGFGGAIGNTSSAARSRALKFARLRVVRAHSTCVLDVIALEDPDERFLFSGSSTSGRSRRTCRFLSSSTDGSIGLHLPDSARVEQFPLLKCSINSIDALALRTDVRCSSASRRWLVACGGDDGLVHCALLSADVAADGSESSRACGTDESGTSHRLSSLFASPFTASHVCAVVAVRFVPRCATVSARREDSVLLVSASSDLQVVVWRLAVAAADGDMQLVGAAAAAALEPLQRARFAVHDPHCARLLQLPSWLYRVAVAPQVSASLAPDRDTSAAEGRCEWYILIGGAGLELLRIRLSNAPAPLLN